MGKNLNNSSVFFPSFHIVILYRANNSGCKIPMLSFSENIRPRHWFKIIHHYYFSRCVDTKYDLHIILLDVQSALSRGNVENGLICQR